MATILIIDDSPTELHLFQSMLEKSGFETLVADSGMNGFQATRKLTHDPLTANIPVIMITTKDQETDKIWGMRQGAVEYIVKPIGQKELAAKINSVMAE